MTYTIFLYEDRFNVLMNQMPDNVKELSREKNDSNNEYLIKTEIKIQDSFDLLQVFHAGMHYGLSPKY